MLKQELVFIMALSTIYFTPALFKELRSTLADIVKKNEKPAVPSTTSEDFPNAYHRTLSHITGKRKAIDLACSGD
jgi:hypothetical protein